MSLHHAAQHLKTQGRGPDDQLIHMSGKEVAGLQALAMAHGGSLTINPKTGLPEAGFLDNLLPTIVGAGIGYFTGSPMLAASIMGGGTFLNTGDLGKGLMAGLGGYGAGSMGSSLAGLGESALAAGSGSVNAVNGMDLASDRAAGMAAPSMSDKFQAGVKAFAANPSMEALGGGKNIAMAAAPALTGMMGGKKALATAPGTEQMIRPYTFAANPQELAQQEKMIGSKYEPGQDTSERTWFKPEFTALPAYKAAEGGLMQEPVLRMAQGGISDLGGYSDGGRLLKGPGDGMSDNIPAQIGAKQPARLADGEFVVPADVVSHLGNGSTDAGAKQLYKMMDRIRAQRTGKKKQAPQVNPAKAMPV